jgi:5-formyltetrahydrofolate cyclo-ligase
MNSEADRSTRQTLRAHYRTRRRQLNLHEQSHHAQAVARHLQTSGLLLGKGCIAGYLANHREGELDCLPAIQRLWSMHRTVVLPVVGKTRGFMELFVYQPGTRLIINRYGISEPEPLSPHRHRIACSVMLLPLVAFDESGGRLGMGGGYYDRFLGGLPPSLRPRLVGLAHEAQRSSRPLPRDDWDIPLDDVVTESGWQNFSTST